MATAKWIGGALGLLSGGPLGALAGFVLGSLFDNLTEERPMMNGNAQHIDEPSRNGFLFALLTLMAYIIRADGKIMHSEMEAARRFLRNNFGEAAAVEGEQIMLRLFERQKQEDLNMPGSYRHTIMACCQQLKATMGAAELLQIVNLLAVLVKADGVVDQSEINALREITLALGLSESEMNSMLNLGSTTLEQAYAVLEVAPTASDDEVRAAYKRLVLKHHPDRVARLGNDVLAAAERKMKEINEAKDIIYKSRGMS